MKILFFLFIIILSFQCAVITVTSLSDIFSFAIALQPMTTDDLLNLKNNCADDGKCSYNGNLILGGSNANDSFFTNLNRAPPDNLPLDENFALRQLDGLTFAEISDKLNVQSTSVSFSVPSNGCPLDGIPLLGGLCTDNPLIVRISRNNRDLRIVAFLVGLTILTLLLLFKVLSITGTASEIVAILQKKINELK